MDNFVTGLFGFLFWNSPQLLLLPSSRKCFQFAIITQSCFPFCKKNIMSMLLWLAGVRPAASSLLELSMWLPPHEFMWFIAKDWKTENPSGVWVFFFFDNIAHRLQQIGMSSSLCYCPWPAVVATWPLDSGPCSAPAHSLRASCNRLTSRKINMPVQL